MLGWGHSTARSPLELEHANGGRETEDAMKRRLRGGIGQRQYYRSEIVTDSSSLKKKRILPNG